MTTYRVGDIQPNPFRDLARYPVVQERVGRLRESIGSTGFWDNVVARIRPDGKPEIAYGHYRLEACRQELGEEAEIGLIIRELSDARMLRMMAEENGEDRNSSEAAHEVVRAVVLAYAEGKIELPAPDAQDRDRTHLREAPGFARLGTRTEPSHPYTTTTVVAFLGGSWTVDRVRDAIEQLAAVESRDVDPEVFRNLPRRYAGEIIGSARHAQRQARASGMTEGKAREVGREVAHDVAIAIGTRGNGRATLNGSAVSLAIGEVRNRAIAKRVPRIEPLHRTPPAYRVAEKLRDYVKGVFTRQYGGSGTYGDLMEALIGNLGSMSLTQPLGPNGPNLELEIADALRSMAAQALGYADRIDGGREIQ